MVFIKPRIHKILKNTICLLYEMEIGFVHLVDNIYFFKLSIKNNVPIYKL